MEIQGKGIYFRQKVGCLGPPSSNKVQGNPASPFRSLLRDRDLAQEGELGVPEASPASFCGLIV